MAEYQVPQSHGLVRVRKRSEHLRCALLFGRVQVWYTVRQPFVTVVFASHADSKICCHTKMFQ